METKNEITQLKQEIARLRQEMDELKQFIHYHPPSTDDHDDPEAAYLTIRCAIFQLVHPANPNHSLINMMGSRDKGAFISMLGADEKTRLLLQVEKDVPEVSLFAEGGKYASSLRFENEESHFAMYGRKGNLGVLLKVQDEAERGQVGVCEAGKPRAVMQARSDGGGGGVSVVHDDGHARVALVSEENSGDVLLVTPDMQVGVKLSSNGLDGGFITVNRANGKAGVILSNIATGGAVIVNDPRGQMMASLPSPNDLPE